jgi:hypothetical protein
VEVSCFTTMLNLSPHTPFAPVISPQSPPWSFIVDRIIIFKGYPLDSANHQEEVSCGAGTLACDRPPGRPLVGGRGHPPWSRGTAPQCIPNKSWLSQMDTQFIFI